MRWVGVDRVLCHESLRVHAAVDVVVTGYCQVNGASMGWIGFGVPYWPLLGMLYVPRGHRAELFSVVDVA